ncbi:TRAP transporter small permease subunit [Agrobacterium tumefaciens]|uniref:TRAP transporter small permease protein n=1 Tax=Agrobacterium tumefaciens TaxID=358 RepID=A0A2L2LM58_AGRTU|nr:TRAP transporter small permease [Agrobacterium tumefaciens]AVH45412.1 hypothetical protein At1D1609_53800 [Agrobacterium tumefaciens]NSY99141.1 TRAP transporter small permease [Agrobacterium tumefaciens]
MNSRTRLRKPFEWVLYACNWLGSMWIFVMMLVVVVDVMLRFFGAPISGSNEIIQASIVVVLYMQIAHTLKEGRVTRSTAVYDVICRKAPKLGRLLGSALNLCGAALLGAMAYLSWSKWLEALERNYFIGAHGVFTFPEWPIKLSIFLGCALMMIQFLLMAFDALFDGDGTANETLTEGSAL